MSKLDNKIVFAVSPDGTGDRIPVVILGIPKQAWEYMKDGKTHTFDLTSAGVPVKLVLFGADSHDKVCNLLQQAAHIDKADFTTDYSIPTDDDPIIHPAPERPHGTINVTLSKVEKSEPSTTEDE